MNITSFFPEYNTSLGSHYSLSDAYFNILKVMRWRLSSMPRHRALAVFTSTSSNISRRVQIQHDLLMALKSSKQFRFKFTINIIFSADEAVAYCQGRGAGGRLVEVGTKQSLKVVMGKNLYEWLAMIWFKGVWQWSL